MLVSTLVRFWKVGTNFISVCIFEDATFMFADGGVDIGQVLEGGRKSHFHVLF